MAKPILEAVLRRDRVIVAGALILLIVLAWGYVLWLMDVMRMGGMEMPGMRMVANPFGAAMIPALQPWSVIEFALMFVMWTIMMFGMMVPSAAPMILIYARVGRCWGVPMDAAEGHLSQSLPGAADVHSTSRRVSAPAARLAAHRISSRTVLHRLLLGANGAAIRWGNHEHSVDRWDCHLRSS